MADIKKCSKCSLSKELSEFNKDKSKSDGYYSSCKLCHKKRWKNYYENNKERVLESNTAYNKTKKGKSYIKLWGQKNRKREAARIKSYRKDPLKRLTHNHRTRLSHIIKAKGYRKNTKTSELIGCGWEDLKFYLESKFTKGMSWNNYGDWHVDHIVPLSSANTEKKIIELMNYQNLQPLWAFDNLSKGNKIE